MDKKIPSVVMLTLLLIGMLTLTFNIQGARADWTWTETIYIRADGSVDPDTAPISTVDNVTYTLTDNIVGAAPSNYDIAVIIERNNIVLNGAGYTLRGTDAFASKGIHLHGRSNVTIKNINIRNFYYSVYLYESSNNTISGNNITNADYGVLLYESSNNTISGNTITNSYWYSVYLYESSNNTISGNNITNNGFGVRLYKSSNSNTVSGNNITNNGSGVLLYESCNSNTVSGNNITNNGYGVGLYESSNNTVSGNDITDNNSDGVGLRYSSNNTVSGNNITNNNQYGVSLYGGSNNAVSGNTITHSESGVRVSLSANNIVSGNTITNSYWNGVGLAGSSSNTVFGNNITNNRYGIGLIESSGNTFYHNNFVDNTQQVYDYAWGDPDVSPSIDVWDDGYPSGGNYWSDYTGVDLYSGPYQNETGSDGIGDTPYVIDAKNRDNYPLTEPWSPVPPLPTTIDALKTEIEELGSEAEIDNQGIVTSLIAKLNVAQKLVDEGKIDQAKNILNAFINEVQAQSGKHITPEAAELLIEAAEHIISNL